MTEPVLAAEPLRLLIAAAVGISALFIGLGAGMPIPILVNTVEKGAGETLQGIVLLIGLALCLAVSWKFQEERSALPGH